MTLLIDLSRIFLPVTLLTLGAICYKITKHITLLHRCILFTWLYNIFALFFWSVLFFCWSGEKVKMRVASSIILLLLHYYIPSLFLSLRFIYFLLFFWVVSSHSKEDTALLYHASSSRTRWKEENKEQRVGHFAAQGNKYLNCFLSCHLGTSRGITGSSRKL